MSKKFDLNVKGVRAASSNKWWEFYFVRYFVGTVVGFGIILGLHFSEYSSLKGLVLPGITSIQDLNSIQSIFIGAVGLCICYIASSPILFLHAYRGDIFARQNNKEFENSAFGYFERVVLSLLIAFIVSSSLYYFTYDMFFPSDKYPYVNNMGLLTVSMLIGIQIYAISFAAFNKFNVSFNYYKDLSKLRSNREEGLNSYDEYVESYKHLREHGNAFFILFLELVMGLMLAIIENPIYSIFFIFLWIVPGMFIWFWGNRLESRLSEI
ncbi:hypothetical protein A6D99_04215 [Aliivibrio fischeri]|nr:hypothetical protein A6D99_04215 [Aliivibrio fischeri]